MGKFSEPNSGYSLLTTAEDYARFLLALINNTGLSLNSKAEMLKNQVVVESYDNKTKILQWGLGLGIMTKIKRNTKKETQIWHWGDNGPFKGYFVISPSKKEGIVYFSNCKEGLKIVQEMTDLFIGSEEQFWLRWKKY